MVPYRKFRIIDSKLPATALFFVLLLLGSLSFGQNTPSKDVLLKYVSGGNGKDLENQSEKFYLQFDKPYYTLGDTIWYKAYVLTDHLTATAISGIMYVDVLNDENKVLKRFKLQISRGIAYGNIRLGENEFVPGTCSIRAYTNWMRNFGEDYFFCKTFYITGFNDNSWLINSRSKFNTGKGEVDLNFKDPGNKPIDNEKVHVGVLAGAKKIFTSDFQTDPDGAIHVDFNLPENPGQLSLVAEDKLKNRHAVIPIRTSVSENIDLQFLPEGGNLVAGLPAHIGFKAIDVDGTGRDIAGVILNREGDKVAQFSSLHLGMGSFDMMIKPGEAYSAKVTVGNGVVENFPLPAVKNEGTSLRIFNKQEKDSVKVILTVSPNTVSGRDTLFLIGKARGVICYAAIVSFQNSNVIEKYISKKLFPQGIAHFVLTTTAFAPLNERQTFIDNNENLKISVASNKEIYAKGDSVQLQIKVSDSNGKPVSGNFSAAVTDDAQVKLNNSQSDNILTHLLLTSDLKGNIDAPAYYFLSANNNAWEALDNLLLTQGWVGYNWQQHIDSAKLQFQPEKSFVVEGSVINVSNKPLQASKVQLFCQQPLIIMDTTTDAKGRFVFEGFPYLNNPVFLLKAQNKRGRKLNSGIKINDPPPQQFIHPIGAIPQPWFLNGDSVLLKSARIAAATNNFQYMADGSHVLKEVKVTATKIIKDSQNLNGAGNADQVIDEKELQQAGKKNLLDLCYSNIKGFRERSYGKNYMWFFVKDKYAIFVIDGIKMTKDDITDFDGMRRYLQAHAVENIKGVEVNYSGKFTSSYEKQFSMGDNVYFQYAFIEITTRSGNGPRFDNIPDMYVYRPMPLSAPAQFYKPRYNFKDTTNHIQDLRSTIDWEPNITTDANGEAKVWFYTADKPSIYSIVIEGVDMKGNLGYHMSTIDVKGIKEKAK